MNTKKLDLDKIVEAQEMSGRNKKGTKRESVRCMFAQLFFVEKWNLSSGTAGAADLLIAEKMRRVHLKRNRIWRRTKKKRIFCLISSSFSDVSFSLSLSLSRCKLQTVFYVWTNFQFNCPPSGVLVVVDADDNDNDNEDEGENDDVSGN